MRAGGVNASFTQQPDPVAGRVDIAVVRRGDITGVAGTGLLAGCSSNLSHLGRQSECDGIGQRAEWESRQPAVFCGPGGESAVNGERGFTFIEMVVVTTILLVLASTVMPLAQVTMQRQREAELHRALA